jgi:hypothetical protein
MAMVYGPLIIFLAIAAYFIAWPLSLFGGGADRLRAHSFAPEKARTTITQFGS